MPSTRKFKVELELTATAADLAAAKAATAMQGIGVAADRAAKVAQASMGQMATAQRAQFRSLMRDVQAARDARATAANAAAAADQRVADSAVANSRRSATAQASAIRGTQGLHAQASAEAIGYTDRLGSSIVSTLGRFATVGAAIGGMKLLTAAIAEAEQRAIGFAQASLAFEKANRASAALGGAKQAAQATPGLLRLSTATGLTFDDARLYNDKFDSASFIGKQKHNITDDVSARLKQAAAVRAARIGGNAGTHGDLAGLLSQFGKIDSETQGLGQLEAIRQALVEGRGDDTELTNQLLLAAGSIVREGGTVESLPELAALVGTTSLTAGPQGAAVRAQQVMRGLKGGLTKHRKGQGAQSSQADYLKKLGIDEKMSVVQMVNLVGADLEQAGASGRDLDVYLGERGFRSAEERQAVIEISQNRKVLADRMARAGTVTGGKAEMEANAAYKNSNLGRASIADAQLEAAKIIRGKETQEVATARAQITAERVADGGDDSSLESVKDLAVGAFGWIFGAGTPGGPSQGRENRIAWSARKRLEEKIQPGVVSQYRRNDMTFSEESSELEYSRAIIAKDRAAGGDPLAGFSDIGKKLDRQIQLMEADQAKQVTPPVLPPRGPQAGAARP